MKSVLVVDDDGDFRKLIRRFLEAAGLQVIEAGAVAQGLETAETVLPHLIITDLMMVGENGYALLQKRLAHPELRNIPIIVVSSYSRKELIYQAMSLGATDYLMKPIQADLLLKRVKKALRDEAFARLEFPADSPLKVRVREKGRITRAGETGFELDVPIRIGRETRLEVKGEILDRLKLKNNIFKTGAMDGVLGSKGYYLNQVVAVGVSEEIAQHIRKIVRIWK